MINQELWNFEPAESKMAIACTKNRQRKGNKDGNECKKIGCEGLENYAVDRKEW